MHMNQVKLEITMSRLDILNHLRRHREEYSKKYEAAQKAYKDRVRALAVEFDAFLKSEESNSISEMDAACNRLMRNIPRPPEDIKEVFDKTIRMLELDTSEQRTLTASQFECWIDGEFPEVRQFLATSASYTGGLGGMMVGMAPR